jgi:signal transduction histidine kinase
MPTGKQVILIVDSDLRTADHAAKLLREQGYEVRVAKDGLAATNLISAMRVDLVLLNFRLAGGRGWELVDYLLNRHSGSPKIMIMDCDDERIRTELLAYEEVDFLSKPVENDVLLGAVRNSLKSKMPASGGGDPDRLASLEKFFPFLAHEIRNPLHAISGALTILQKRCDLKDDVVNRSVRIIKEEVEHLNGFVQECLDFVRPPVKRRLIDVDVNEVAEVVINVVAYMFADPPKRVQLTKDFDPNIPKIPANYEELKRAFLNILKNSFEAVGEEGAVTIRTKFTPDPGPGAVEISFSDNGTGVKKENLNNLFTPFFTTKLRGTGLGLAICRRIIVDHHGGKISIRSEEGSGATVKIELPAGAKSLRVGGQGT